MAQSVTSLLLLAITCLSYDVTCQRTYMRSCECEYVTNGKCAYTLLLPLSSNALPSACSDGPKPNVTTPAYDDDVTMRLDTLAGNLSSLAAWSITQAQLLAQLQSVVISLQNSNLPRDPDVINTTRTDIFQQIANISTYVDAILNSVTQNSAAVDDVRAEVRSSLTRQAALEEEVSALRTTVTDQDEALEELRAEWTAAVGQLCSRRGLLVSGSDYGIPDESITASSTFNEDHDPTRVRINNTNIPGAWCPGEPNQDYEYIQFDLGQDRVVYGVVTKGRYDWGQWVTSYRVQYSVSADPDTWHNVLDVVGNPRVFLGNSDRNSAVTNLFWQHVTARYIRVIPLFGNNNNKCMRADVIGCVSETS